MDLTGAELPATLNSIFIMAQPWYNFIAFKKLS